MAERRIGIIMNGVTGRMGIQPAPGALHRGDPRPGRRDAARTATVLMPDPILVGRNRGQGRGARRARTASRAGRTDLDAALADPDDTLFFDAGHDADARRAAAPGDRGRQACLLREADRRHAGRRAGRWRAWPSAAGIKNGVVQDKLFLPGLRKLQEAASTAASSAASSRCAASSATGCSRATGSRRSARRGTTARTRAAASSSICSATGATCSTTCSARSRPSRCLGATHIPTRVDESGQPYQADADDAAYATFELEGGIIAQINSSWCTRVRRDELVDLPGGRHAWAAPSPACTKCWTQHRVNTPKPVWNPDVPQPIDFFDALAGGAGQRSVSDNGFRVQWETVPPARRRRDAPLAVGPARRRQGRAAGGARAATSWRERRWIDVPPTLEPSRAAADAITESLAPTAGGRRLRAPTTHATPSAAPPCRHRGRAAFSAHRLCGGACRRRPAGRQRSLARRRRSTGTAPSPSATTSGSSAWAWRRRWTPRSAAWGSTGRAAQRADPPRPRRRARRAGRADRLRRRHRSSGAGPDVTLDDVIRAYEEQCEAIEKLGGRIILMASRALAALRDAPDDYARVYGRILAQVRSR